MIIDIAELIACPNCGKMIKVARIEAFVDNEHDVALTLHFGCHCYRKNVVHVNGASLSEGEYRISQVDIVRERRRR